MFRTICAKYEGKCRRCGGKIYPGDKIRYGGRGLTYHMAAVCGEAAKRERFEYRDGGGREPAMTSAAMRLEAELDAMSAAGY